MTLKQAMETLADYYGVGTDGKKVIEAATIHGPLRREIWDAWEVVLRKIKRIS